MFAELAKRPDTICPFLGMAGSRTGYQESVSEEHRCYAFGDPAELSAEQQQKVCLQPGGVYRGFHRPRLGRLLDHPGLGLTVTRGLLGSARLVRAGKGAPAEMVVLVSRESGQLALLPGESCPIYRGDVIDVSAPDGRVTQIEVLSVAGIIAEALSAVFDDTSVSEIFDGENLA